MADNLNKKDVDERIELMIIARYTTYSKSLNEVTERQSVFETLEFMNEYLKTVFKDNYFINYWYYEHEALKEKFYIY